MNKEDIVRILSRRTGFTQKDLAEILDAFFQLVIEATAAGKRVYIKSFGVFDTQEKSAKVTNDVRTPNNKLLVIPPKRIPVFRPAANYRKFVQGGKS